MDAVGQPAALATWEFQLPLTKPLSLNDRGHWSARARQIKEVRDASFLLAKHHKIPMGLGRIKVTLTYHPRDARRRDSDNLVATLKPVVDGLVQARIIPDDTDEYLEPTMPRIGQPTGGMGRLMVRVDQLG